MNNPQSLKEKVVKGSFIALILTFLGSSFAYLTRILLSYNLSIENYGLFYAIFGLFSIASGYIDLGFGYSIVYFLPKYIKQKNYSQAWNIYISGQMISLIMAIIVAIILIFFAPLLAKNYFKVSGSEIIVYIFCIYLIIFTVINGLIQVYSGLQKEKYYSSITVSRWFLTLIFSALFLLFGFSNVIFFAVAWVLGHLLTAIFFLFLLFYKHPFFTKNKITLKFATIRQMFKFAFPSMIDTFVTSAVVISEISLLTLMKGVREVGIYNIVGPLACISVVLVSPINILLLPLVSHLMEGEKQKMDDLMEKILIMIPFVGSYFALFLILFPSSIVGVIFGQKWIGLVEMPLTIISLGAILILINGVLSAITAGIGRIREKLRAVMITAIISICLNVLLIWYYGIVGLVTAICIGSLILTILLIRVLKSAISFKVPYLFYLKLALFSAIVYIIIKITNIYPRSLFELICFGVIYTTIFLIFGLFLKIYDKGFLFMLFPKKNL